jgi:hypothetical protein
MTIEGEVQQDEEVSYKETCEMKSSNESPESFHISLQMQCETAKTETAFNTPEDQAGSFFSDKMKRVGRLAIFLGVVIALVAGRFSVPDNEVACVQDKVMEALGFANKFINTPGNEIFRDVFLFFSSFMLDVIFIGTLGYWVLHGKSGRLPAALGVFYGTRAIVQSLWTSPFPEGNYWYAPFGILSLVVPYGRQSDFFFSGHSGFLVICALEWHKLKFPRVRNFVIASAIYTMFILVIYRTHYSIDVFTGVFFAEWSYSKADKHRETIDKYWVHYLLKLRKLVGLKASKIPCLDADRYPLTPQV